MGGYGGEHWRLREGKPQPVTDTDSQVHNSRKRRPSPVKAAMFSLVAIVVVLLAVEGACNLGMVGWEYRQWRSQQRAKSVAEDRHVAYDAELGWVHIPNKKTENIYGPGRSLTIDANGMRAVNPVAKQQEPGRYRIHFLGDSFTMGYGVDDRHTIAEMLRQRLDVDTITMAQGGYGIDQCYLWYMRDGAAYEADMLVFMFIADDFRRTARDRFLSGYGKPYFELGSGGDLELRNVPVPKRVDPGEAFLYRGQGWNYLRTRIGVTRALSSWLSREPTDPDLDAAFQRGMAVSFRLFDKLHEQCKARGQRFVLVYLPTLTDLDPKFSKRDKECLARIGDHVKSSGINFISLRPVFTSHGNATALFGQKSKHYNEAGTAFVAGQLANLLPQLDAKIPGNVAAPEQE